MLTNQIKIVLMGTSDFAVKSFEKIIDSELFKIQAIYTQPDRPANRGQINKSAVSKLADNKGLSRILRKPFSIKAEEEMEFLRGLQPDIIFVVSYGMILTESLLSIPKYGAVNQHASLLPKYRGASPIQAAILAGEKKTGITFFKLTPRVDDGPIIWQESIPLNGDETFLSLHNYLAEFGSKLVCNVLNKYCQNKIEPNEQNHSLSSHCNKIKKSDGEIKWGVYSAEEVEKMVRAFTPWPGTYTKLNGKILRIHKCILSENRPHMHPGTVFKDGDDILVRAKNKSIKLLEVQLEGKKKSTAREFMNGHTKFVGTNLG